MPAAAERALKAEASKKGLTGERRSAYIYDSLRAMGWKPKRERAKRALGMR